MSIECHLKYSIGLRIIHLCPFKSLYLRYYFFGTWVDIYPLPMYHLTTFKTPAQPSHISSPRNQKLYSRSKVGRRFSVFFVLRTFENFKLPLHLRGNVSVPLVREVMDQDLSA